MEHPIITIYHPVESVYLCKGETLTVYMRNIKKPSPDMGPSPCEQVELRVTQSGELEIFTDPNISIKDWDSWYDDSMKTKG